MDWGGGRGERGQCQDIYLQYFSLTVDCESGCGTPALCQIHDEHEEGLGSTQTNHANNNVSMFSYRGPTVGCSSDCATPALGQVHNEQEGRLGRTESSYANNVSLSSDRGPTVSWVVVLIVTHLHLTESCCANSNVSMFSYRGPTVDCGSDSDTPVAGQVHDEHEGLGRTESSYANNNVSLSSDRGPTVSWIVILTVTHLDLARFVTKTKGDLEGPWTYL